MELYGWPDWPCSMLWWETPAASPAQQCGSSMSSDWPFWVWQHTSVEACVSLAAHQHGSMLAWQHINVKACQRGSTQAWQHISMVAHMHGSTSVWKHVSVTAHQWRSTPAWQHISVEAHQPGSASAWLRANMVAHQCGSTSVWEHVRLAAHQCGSMSAWQHIGVVATLSSGWLGVGRAHGRAPSRLCAGSMVSNPVHLQCSQTRSKCTSVQVLCSNPVHLQCSQTPSKRTPASQHRAVRWLAKDQGHPRHSSQGTLHCDCTVTALWLQAYFGTLDSWLIYQLTGGLNGGIHVTDGESRFWTALLLFGPCLCFCALLCAPAWWAHSKLSLATNHMTLYSTL